jgi:hypothetical protein
VVTGWGKTGEGVEGRDRVDEMGQNEYLGG